METPNIERRTLNVEVPLRVDFAGGWLDVPRFAMVDGCVVNCAITPGVSLAQWPYHKNAGLGGSAAWAELNGRDSIAADLAGGAGWQDPAVIRETGLCVWRSGERPVLEIKTRGEFLTGRMGLAWTGAEHDTAKLAEHPRDFSEIQRAGEEARRGVWQNNIWGLITAIAASYEAQLGEGMKPLENLPGALARKYCGSGHGGYALYIFTNQAARDASGLVQIEPFIRDN